MPRTHRLLNENRLWRLITVRWSAQLTDGLYQSALASYVLFSPERQASATAAAIAFTTVLLPYSLIGPFVGTILDKYSRRQILFFANLGLTVTLLVVATAILLNATGFELTLIVLISFGINRLILAGLSASLPRVVTPEIVVAANIPRRVELNNNLVYYDEENIEPVVYPSTFEAICLSFADRFNVTEQWLDSYYTEWAKNKDQIRVK